MSNILIQVLIIYSIRTLNIQEILKKLLVTLARILDHKALKLLTSHKLILRRFIIWVYLYRSFGILEREATGFESAFLCFLIINLFFSGPAIINFRKSAWEKGVGFAFVLLVYIPCLIISKVTEKYLIIWKPNPSLHVHFSTGPASFTYFNLALQVSARARVDSGIKNSVTNHSKFLKIAPPFLFLDFHFPVRSPSIF